MKYSEMFSDSAEMHPEGGTRLSPAACGFILAELEGRVRNTEEYIAERKIKGDGPDSTGITMAERHLEGLVSITEAVRVGMNNK